MPSLRHLSMAVLCALLLFWNSPLWAQGQQTGDLSGQVTDGDGRALAGVVVTVGSTSLLSQRSAVTGFHGRYGLRGLPAGDYKLVFELDGKTSVQRTATVRVGLLTRADVQLEAREGEETLVVLDELPPALANTSISTNFDAETLQALPIRRQLENIAMLAPGVTTVGEGPGLVSINGAYSYDNAFLLDGVDIASSTGNAYDLFIEDALEEVQILTSGVSAEYGRFTGGVINAITKVGGNEFEGSLRVDLSNPEWRETTPLEDAAGVELEGDTNETLSATLGGYLVKDRLWFFSAGRATDSSTSDIFAYTEVPYTSTTDNERFEVKLTGNLSSSQTLQATYSENDTLRTKPSFFFSIDPRTFDRIDAPTDLAVARYSGVWHEDWFGQLQYSERNVEQRSGGTSTDIIDSPFLGFSPFAHYNAPYFDENDPLQSNNEQLTASVSHYLDSERWGSHDLKAGAERFSLTRVGGNSQSSTDFIFDVEVFLDANDFAQPDAQGRLQPFFNFLSTLELWFPERGSQIEIEANTLYLNDRWNLDDHWSFNLGVRYEDVEGTSTAGLKPADSTTLLPRLAASYDIHGNGKYKVDISYAQYAGSYNEGEFGSLGKVGTPDSAFAFYIGPSGLGLDFAPGLDLANYLPYNANFQSQSVNFEDGLSSAKSEEWSASVAAQLRGGGYVKLTWVRRELRDFLENFIDQPGDPLFIETPIGVLPEDREVYRNTNVPEREYQSLQLQGRYRLAHDLYVEGNWTYQLRNHGNFVGEASSQPGGGSPYGDYPELFSAERHYPDGRLPGYQQHRARLWSVYNLDLQRAGTLTLSLLLNYDSGSTTSLVSSSRLTAAQRALNPGYLGLPFNQDIFFARRGTIEFEDSATVDLTLQHALPVWRTVEPWVRFEVLNVLDEDKQISWNTSITADPTSPLDDLGLPTGYVESPLFGQATSNGNFVSPRQYRISAGIRF